MMNLGEMRIRSRALGRHVGFSFSIPDEERSGPGPYPALLQLHGASDDHTAWFARTRLSLYLENVPLVAVAPDGALSLWGNRGPRERYEDFLIEDLLPACERFFPVRPGPWAIGGLSMGGFGAIRLGLKHPDRFASIYAHSSYLPTRAQLAERHEDMTEEQRADFDVYALAASAVPRPDRPRLAFDCGTDDFLLDQNRAFHARLESVGYPHEYAEYPGAHTWEYWDDHVRDALPQHLAALGVAPSGE